LARQGPIIQLETLGPDRLLTGQAAEYKLRIRNVGQTEAEEFVLRVSLPAWVELVAAQPSTGQLHSVRQTENDPATSPAARELQWQIPVLAVQQEEVLSLRLLPRRSAALELAVAWDHRPARTRTTIAVQEPQLQLRLVSSRELLARSRQTLEVQIENSGTAPAEAVHLRLAADNNAEISPPTVLLETVAVGERKSLLVEITPHRAGAVTLTCQAMARGGFQSQFSEKLWIREPQLALRWQLPERVYLGSEVPGRLSLANLGDAACEDPLVRVPLPATVELVDIPQQTEWAEASRELLWKPGPLPPQTERSLVLRLRPRELGAVAWSAIAASGPWQASASGTMEVEGFASLNLVLVDPGRPVPAGSEVPYEVRVENRGTKTVQACEVVVFFSWGIEPMSADGAPALLAPGQVLFSQVGPIAPGGEKRLRVLARADQPGSHTCRAELVWDELPSKLVAQQVTAFYSVEGGKLTPVEALANQETNSPGQPKPMPQTDAPRVASRPAENAAEVPQGHAEVSDQLQPATSAPASDKPQEAPTLKR
jgi:hypothetical protein